MERKELISDFCSPFGMSEIDAFDASVGAWWCGGSGMKKRSNAKARLTPHTIKMDSLQPKALSIISVNELKPMPQ